MLAEVKDKVVQFLARRARAYQLTFNGVGASKVVLADLARFCRASQSTAHRDPYMAARFDGRREVWLRISEHLHLPPEELFKLYSDN